MPSIRSVKPEFWENEDLARLGTHARELAIALANLADDHGRLRDQPGRIQRFVWAATPQGPPVDVRGTHELLSKLEAIGYIVRYAAGSEHYIALATFGEDQRPRRRRDSQLPEPPQEVVDQAAELRSQSHDRLFGAEPAFEFPELAKSSTSPESPPGASAGLGQQTPDAAGNCPPVVVVVEGVEGSGGGSGGEEDSTALPPLAGARARGNETSQDDGDGPADDFDFEDEGPDGLSAALKHKLHTQLGSALKRCFGASDRWNGGAADRWLSDMGAAVQAENVTVQELEGWLVRDETRPDVADMDDPMRWLRRMFARRGTQQRGGRKKAKRDPKHGSKLQV